MDEYFPVYQPGNNRKSATQQKAPSTKFSSAGPNSLQSCIADSRDLRELLGKVSVENILDALYDSIRRLDLGRSMLILGLIEAEWLKEKLDPCTYLDSLLKLET